ncbi:MAG: phosphate-starvation-inducible PsiE family protein [Bacteroidales bacterium]|nr:phosphate-starvation-inducible PsiE family protein [Bacteroidales bacterium]
MKLTNLICSLKRITQWVEKFIIITLIIMMSVILILATIELGYHLYSTIASHNVLIPLDELMDLFGVFLLVLIGIELLDTIKVYLKQNVIHVEVVVLVAIIALARKIVILKIEEISGEVIIGIGILIVALSVAYYLIKKTGLLVIDYKNNPWDNIKDDLLESGENQQNRDQNINEPDCN